MRLIKITIKNDGYKQVGCIKDKYECSLNVCKACRFFFRTESGNVLCDYEPPIYKRPLNRRY